MCNKATLFLRAPKLTVKSEQLNFKLDDKKTEKRLKKLKLSRCIMTPESKLRDTRP